VDLNVGTSVALIDLWFSVPKLVERVTAGEPSIKAFIGAIVAKNLATWKWMDRPISIGKQGDALLVKASAGNSVTVLNFRGYDRLGRGTELNEFTRAASSLISLVPDFGRVDGLLRTVAVFRWARESGASFVGPVPALGMNRERSPDGLVVGLNRDWYAVAPGGSVKERTSEACKRLSTAVSTAIAQDSPFSKEFSSRDFMSFWRNKCAPTAR
jgi:hypothetical protein